MSAPITVILFGATGDLAKRKLIPGLMHLFQSRLLDDLRVVGTSLDDLGPDEFRALADAAIREHSTREITDEDYREFLQRLDFVPLSAGPQALHDAVIRCEELLPGDNEVRVHYLSVPPKAALSAVKTIADADHFSILRELAEGRLVQPFDVAVETGAYFLLTPQAKAASPALAAFRLWLTN
mgnify:CR=1 FL=1